MKHTTAADEGFDWTTAKIVLGVLCGFQFAVVAIVIVLSPSVQAGAYAVVASWPAAVLAVALVAGPLLFRWRLLRVRARRAKLLQSEWMVDRADATAERRPRPPHP
jgi:hypothetical protein